MSQPLRRTVAVLAATAVAATIGIVADDSAFASYPGGNNGLTALHNGTVSWQDGDPKNLTIHDTSIGGGQWSPDGSRTAFVNASGVVETVRYNDGSSIQHFDFPDSAAKSDPTWISNGTKVMWAENGSLWWNTSDGSLPLSPFATRPVRYTPPAGVTYNNPDGGRDGLIVFDATGATGTDAVVITESQLLHGTKPTTIVANASQPAIAPGGLLEVAFVRPDSDGHDQIWASGFNGANLVQITSDPVDHSNPTWAPNQDTTPVIAFDEGNSVFTAPSDGSAARNPTPTGLTGPPAYQTTKADTVVRVAGPNRFGTAVAASQMEWATAGATGQTGLQPAQAVVLSRSDTFADALAGSTLATAKQGPLLMTPPTSLNPETAAEIRRVLGTNGGTVYILGDTGAISANVATAVQKLGGTVPYTTVRLQGANRYGTAVAIAKAISPHPANIFVTTGLNFPDALAAGAAAGSLDEPGVSDPSNAAVLVLSTDVGLPTDTKAYIGSQPGAQLWGIGTGGAVLNDLGYHEFELAGENRYETADEVASIFFSGESVTGFATGANWPDALAGGALMGTLHGPLLLAPPAGVIPETAALLSAESGADSEALVFGGSDVVSDTILNRVGTEIGGVVPFNKVVVGPSSSVATGNAATLSTKGR